MNKKGSMIVVNEVIGTRSDIENSAKQVELVELEWFELGKRIQSKRTSSGTDIAIRLLGEGQRLRHDDILYTDKDKIIIVDLLPCEAIAIKPSSMYEMGKVCYEIGNKHMPLYIQDETVLMPFEMPMFRWLEASGFNPEKVLRRLLVPLRSNVAPHGHGAGSSLFTKIMNIASGN